MRRVLGRCQPKCHNYIAMPNTTTISWTRVDPQGRVVIPAELRRRLDLEPGSSVAFVLQDGLLSLMTVGPGIERAQRIVKKHTKGKSLVDELIAERRAEAARE
jgi:AbrB family looped-hinge helix DNA binding protein